MPKEPQPIIINDFQKGIAPSPHLGFADIRNIDIHQRPGIARLNFTAQTVSASPVSTTFTANAGTEVCTVVSSFGFNGHSATGRAVTVSNSGGGLPAGLAAGTVYFIIEVTSLTLKLATTKVLADAGTAIDITSAGTGTHTMTSVDMGTIKHFASDPYSSNMYAQDANGRVWRATSVGQDWYLINGNTLTNANAQGLAIWHNYLLAFRSAKVDVYGSLTAAEASRAWSNDWASLNASAGESNTHTAIVGQDDILYFADRNTTTGIPYVGSLSATGTFDPSNAATYTFNNQALDLPSYKTINCLEELGDKLMIGTVGREIYPWDRTSDSFDLPLLAAEEGIKAMKTLNNVLYFAAGTRGNVYASIGSSTKLVKQLPPSITGVPYNAVNIGSMIGHKGKLYFGVECKLASGVWSIDLNTGALVFENKTTAGYGTLSANLISALYSGGAEHYLVGWKDVDNTLYGIDSTLKTSYYFEPSYGGYFDSQYIPVGTSLNKRTFSNLIINLDKPLASSEGVKVYYRKNLTDSFTLLGTFDYSTYAAAQSGSFAAPITDAIGVQVRAELAVGSSATASPELVNIILN